MRVSPVPPPISCCMSAIAWTAGIRCSRIAGHRAGRGSGPVPRRGNVIPANFLVGMDVGSTTVKAVVVDAATDGLWRDYQRHETKQPEKVLEFLQRIDDEVAGIARRQLRLFITGTGGSNIAASSARSSCRKSRGLARGRKDASRSAAPSSSSAARTRRSSSSRRIPRRGRKKKIPSMNDKCAGGTGAVIDKINAKLKIPAEELASRDTTESSCTRSPESAASSPRPTSTGCRRKAFRPTN